MSEITLVAPGGIRTALQQLIPVFETATGHKVTPTFCSGGAAKSRTIDGELFDVPVVQPPLDTVIASGKVVPSTETPIATVSVVIGIPAGTPRPDISTAEGVKRFLLGATSIAYPAAARGAACGVSFEATMAKLGISDAMAPKVKNSQGGWEAITMLAEGQVDIGVTFASEMDPDPRVEMIGAMPRDLSIPTGFVAFVNAQSKEPDAAGALVKFLTTPEAQKVFTACGMKPGK